MYYLFWRVSRESRRQSAVVGTRLYTYDYSVSIALGDSDNQILKHFYIFTIYNKKYISMLFTASISLSE